MSKKPDDFETLLAQALAESKKYPPVPKEDYNTQLRLALAFSASLNLPQPFIKAKAKDEKTPKDVIASSPQRHDVKISQEEARQEEAQNAALALQLHQLELAEAAERRQTRIKKENEAYLKQLSIQALDLKRKEEETAQKFKALQEIQPLLKAPPMTDVDANAHKYAISDIRPNLPVFIRIDNTYKFSDETLSLDQVEKEVLEFVGTIPPNMNPPSVESIKQTFAATRVQKSAVEEVETLANVPELLSRTWTLTKKMGSVVKMNEERGKIARLLADNIAYGGGCMAGLVARLYTGSYPSMIGAALEMSLVESPSAAAKPFAKK